MAVTEGAASTGAPSRSAAALRRQVRERWPLLVALYASVAVAFATLLVVRFTSDVTVAELTRDPLQYLEAPVYTGVVAVASGLLWAAIAGACALGSLLLRAHPAAAQPSEDARFLLAAAGLTALLMLDDVFMLHEVVFPEHLGVDERIVYAAYGLAVAAFLARFRATILRHDFLLLALALAAFAASLFIDATDEVVRYPQSYLWEDGAKVAGILTWGAFFALAALRSLRGEAAE